MFGDCAVVQPGSDEITKEDIEKSLKAYFCTDIATLCVDNVMAAADTDRYRTDTYRALYVGI